MNKTTKKPGKRLSAENIATGKRLLKYIMDLYKYRFIMVFICILLSAVASISVSLSLKYLLDDYIIKMSTLNSTFFHVFIVLPFCTIRNLFYCIFSLLGSAIVRLPLLPASLAPYFRSYASCFTSSSNSSPAE